jgi:hypothetical protein
VEIEKIIDAVIDRDGCYSDYPADGGRATWWGVTGAVAPMAIATICAFPSQRGNENLPPHLLGAAWF